MISQHTESLAVFIPPADGNHRIRELACGVGALGGGESPYKFLFVTLAITIVILFDSSLYSSPIFNSAFFFPLKLCSGFTFLSFLHYCCLA